MRCPSAKCKISSGCLYPLTRPSTIAICVPQRPVVVPIVFFVASATAVFTSPVIVPAAVIIIIRGSAVIIITSPSVIIVPCRFSLIKIPPRRRWRPGATIVMIIATRRRARSLAAIRCTIIPVVTFFFVSVVTSRTFLTTILAPVVIRSTALRTGKARRKTSKPSNSRHHRRQRGQVYRAGLYRLNP